jgi:hypothetical protein
MDDSGGELDSSCVVMVIRLLVWSVVLGSLLEVNLEKVSCASFTCKAVYV